MSELQIVGAPQPNKLFATDCGSHILYEYYLVGPIGEPEEYMELCHALRSARQEDMFVLRINSRGGDVSSERMIVNAIRESEALVRGFIEYACMSAATGVFLACHEHGWGEHIQFMAHCSWWGSVGKNPDIKSQTEFGIRQMEEEIETTYTGLLTPEEIKQCNDGKEFWFGSKELEERIIEFHEHRQEMMSQEGEEFIPQQSLDDLIKQSVDAAMQNVLWQYDLVVKPVSVKVPRKDVKKSVDQAAVEA